MVAIAFYLNNLPVSFVHNDAAPVITVPWTGGLDPLFLVRG
jgi:hypothetical protein